MNKFKIKSNSMKKLLVLLFFLSLNTFYAQDYFPTGAGVKTTDHTLVAFTNATIYVTPEKILKNGTLLIENGKIINVGTAVKIPKGAKIVNLSGKTVYPSFIDLYSDFGIKKPKRAAKQNFGNGMQKNTKQNNKIYTI
jgi:imidazolonepropionase-like amidohydrolase